MCFQAVETKRFRRGVMKLMSNVQPVNLHHLTAASGELAGGEAAEEGGAVSAGRYGRHSVLCVCLCVCACVCVSAATLLVAGAIDTFDRRLAAFRCSRSVGDPAGIKYPASQKDLFEIFLEGSELPTDCLGARPRRNT